MVFIAEFANMAQVERILMLLNVVSAVFQSHCFQVRVVWIAGKR
jgi:hypothetical protein